MDDFIDNEDPVIRSAALRGSLMMNKYYSLTDESITFRVAMGMLVPVSSQSTYILLSVLHPSYKTSYFVKAGWECDWIKAAEDLT